MHSSCFLLGVCANRGEGENVEGCDSQMMNLQQDQGSADTEAWFTKR